MNIAKIISFAPVAVVALAGCFPVASPTPSAVDPAPVVSPTADVSPIAGDVKIDEKHFPDPIFRAYVAETFDTNTDGKLQVDERNITAINVQALGLNDLKGIEHFFALSDLQCDQNALTVLDVSALSRLTALNCASNPIEVLDLTQNPALTVLRCENNALAALDVTQCAALDAMDCTANNLARLDLAKNPLLQVLRCRYNKLTALDLSQNPQLFSLDCTANNLTTLDLSQNQELETCFCDSAVTVTGQNAA